MRGQAPRRCRWPRQPWARTPFQQALGSARWVLLPALPHPRGRESLLLRGCRKRLGEFQPEGFGEVVVEDGVEAEAGHGEQQRGLFGYEEGALQRAAGDGVALAERVGDAHHVVGHEAQHVPRAHQQDAEQGFPCAAVALAVFVAVELSDDEEIGDQYHS